MARLIAMASLPAAGKSSIAQHLARSCGAIWLRIDSMDQAIWASGTAPRDLRDWSYRAAQAIAADNLALGLNVIADCVNDRQEARDGWRRQRAAREPKSDGSKWCAVILSSTAGESRPGRAISGDWRCPTGMQLRPALTTDGTGIAS